MKLKKVLSLALTLTMVFSLTACGGSKAETTQGTATEEAPKTEAAAEAPAAEAEAEAPAAEASGNDIAGKTVVFIPKLTGNAFFEAANDGAQKYAAEWGITVD